MIKARIFILIFLIPYVHRYSAQSPDSGSVYYKRAVSAAKIQNYLLADSLYEISIYYHASPNAYFNRAVVKSELHDRGGYCENLAFSSGMGDKEASTLFLKHCGKTDTIYTERISKQTPSVFAPAYQVSFRSQYMNDVLIARYRMNTGFHSFSWAKTNSSLKSENIVSDTILKMAILKDKTSNFAEYPGGISAMMLFMQQNVNYPAEAREAGLGGKVFLRFVINTLGYIQDIEVLKGIPDCKSCDEETIRIINMFPRWHPAKLYGKPVNTNFNLPFSFKVNR